MNEVDTPNDRPGDTNKYEHCTAAGQPWNAAHTYVYAGRTPQAIAPRWEQEWVIVMVCQHCLDRKEVPS